MCKGVKANSTPPPPPLKEPVEIEDAPLEAPILLPTKNGPRRKKCFISVAASAEQLVTIGKAAERTWVRRMEPHCTVR